MTTLRALFARWVPLLGFRGSQDYWRWRYRLGGDSGAGSRGSEAIFKAAVVNRFVRSHGIRSVIEFGCGDGQQLALAEYDDYVGVDISADAVNRCRAKFPQSGMRFLLAKDYRGEKADLALSLDVVYHLTEDRVYLDYLDRLFSSATKFVLIYSSDGGKGFRTMPHVQHRHVSEDIATRFADFSPIELGVKIEGSDHPGSRAAKFLAYKRI